MAEGVPTVGALVELGGRTLLVVTMDLESGGAPGGTADRLRRMEAWAVRGATESALRTAGALDGWVMAGDINLVGTRDPLEILSRTAAASHGLGIAMPLQLDGASPATWEDLADRFTPGRLDYVFYPRSRLTAAGGFVFSSDDLSARWRERHGLRAETSRATDHLPVVTDLRWVERGE
jgi:endonuclease/exonuclease/phosphatase family metal-dependent hydrolase